MIDNTTNVNFIISEAKRIKEEHDITRAIEIVSYFNQECKNWFTPDVSVALDMILEEVKKK